MNEAAPDPLLVGVRAGTPDLGAIYAAHRGAMFRAAAQILGPYEKALRGVSAEDVVSQVVSDWQAKGLRRTVTNLRGYVITSTRNRAIDTLRRATRELDADDTLRIRLERRLSDDFAAEMVDAGTDVEATALEHIDQEQIRAHLHLLTENERYVIQERVFKRRPPTEVADELGVSSQRVPQLARAGAERLARALGIV
jgi:RNA polymerase sigma factor (sigma-70 family)